MEERVKKTAIRLSRSQAQAHFSIKTCVCSQKNCQIVLVLLSTTIRKGILKFQEYGKFISKGERRLIKSFTRFNLFEAFKTNLQESF